MNLACNCNNPHIYTQPICRTEFTSILTKYFYSVSNLKCLRCGWKSDEIKKYDTGSPYTFFTKMSCRFKGHRDFELILDDADGIVHACVKCGFKVVDYDNYIRIGKLKKLLNK